MFLRVLTTSNGGDTYNSAFTSLFVHIILQIRPYSAKPVEIQRPIQTYQTVYYICIYPCTVRYLVCMFSFVPIYYVYPSVFHIGPSVGQPSQYLNVKYGIFTSISIFYDVYVRLCWLLSIIYHLIGHDTCLKLQLAYENMPITKWAKSAKPLYYCIIYYLLEKGFKCIIPLYYNTENFYSTDFL